jgi:hypothetical protein
MAMSLRRRRRRILVEGCETRRFRITREADPFGDLDRAPYDAIPNLTESGDLHELFADLPVEPTL